MLIWIIIAFIGGLLIGVMYHVAVRATWQRAMDATTIDEKIKAGIDKALHRT